MKYQVTYRLTHTEYIPITSTLVLDVQTHRELLGALARTVTKWEARGYKISIVQVQGRQKEQASKRRKKNA